MISDSKERHISLQWEEFFRWQVFRNRVFYFLIVGTYFLGCEYIWVKFFMPLHPFPINYVVLFLQSCINFFSAQYLGNMLIYRFAKVLPLPRKIPEEKVKVAMLYCTKDDFLKDVAVILYRECIKTKWLDFWILDDSKEKKYKNLIKHFAATHKKTYLFRRSTNRGYKAGAINDWMRENGSDYQYLFIVDSDSIVARQEIFRALTIAEANPQFFGYQLCSKFYALSSSTFETAMLLTSKGVAANHVIFWRLGYGIFFGHNTLIRIKDLMEIGGMVESSQEDIDTLIKAGKNGKKIAFLEDVFGYEAVPPDYISFRVRTMRWTANIAHSLGYFMKGVLMQRYFILFAWMGFLLPLCSVANIFIMSLELVLGVNLFPSFHYVMLNSLFGIGILSQLLTYDKEDLKFITKLGWGLLYTGNVGLAAIVSLVIGLVKKVPFIVTPKEKQKFSLSDYKLELSFGVTIFIISLLHPTALMINICWYCAPLLLVLISKKESKKHEIMSIYMQKSTRPATIKIRKRIEIV